MKSVVGEKVLRYPIKGPMLIVTIRQLRMLHNTLMIAIINLTTVRFLDKSNM